MTTNGLSNEEFSEIKKSLNEDLKTLEHIINSDKGHLGDIISGLMTTKSSMNIKIEKLKMEFQTQKDRL